MSKLTPVTFTKAWRGYSAGETAGFSADQAQALIDSGTASQPGKQATAAKPAGAKPATAPTAPPADAPVAAAADDEKP